MRKIGILVAAVAGICAACRTQNVLPTETRKVLDTGQRFVLLSLDPTAKNLKVVLTTSSPQPTFDRVLERAGLPLAKDK